MAIDSSLFNSKSLADYAGIDSNDPKKKKNQLTGTMLLGGQQGTFNGELDLEDFRQQLQQNTGYQPPPNYGMNQQASQMPQQPVPPTLPAPAPTPPVGASPISGEYGPLPLPGTPDGSDGRQIQMPPGNQPYQPPPPPSDFGHYPINPVSGPPPEFVVDDDRYKGDDYLYRGPIQDQPYQPPPGEQYYGGPAISLEDIDPEGYKKFLQENPQPTQPIDPSFAKISGGPYNPPQMQQPNPFANEPGRDSNGMLIPGYGEPPPGTFLSQPVDRPQDMYNQYRSQVFSPQSTPQLTDEQKQQITGQNDFLQNTPQDMYNQYRSQVFSPQSTPQLTDEQKQQITSQDGFLQQPVMGPQDMYNQYQSQLTELGFDPGQDGFQDGSLQQLMGPIAPDYQYNSDNTMRSISGMGTGLAEGVRYKQSQQFDPITGQWGMPGGEGGKFMPGISIGY